MPEAEAVVVFSCVGRIQTLDPLMNEEIESIKNAWNVPVTVMFSNSEMGSPTGGNLEMHKIKADAIALKEKKLFVQAAALLLLGSCCVALFSANKALGN